MSVIDKMLSFNIPVDALTKIRKWKAEQDTIVADRQKKEGTQMFPSVVKPDWWDFPCYGIIGGSITYSFTPTSIGTVIMVKHANGNKLDVTIYDD